MSLRHMMKLFLDMQPEIFLISEYYDPRILLTTTNHDLNFVNITLVETKERGS